MTYLRYLWYILRHKWYVGVECWRHGLYWRALVHDLSKLRPSEFQAYRRHFYGVNRGRQDDWDFELAWLKHQKRNRHHWQWWVLPKDDGSLIALPMAKNDLEEMICDWDGMAKLFKTKGTVDWYAKNRHKMKLHPETQRTLDERLTYVVENKREEELLGKDLPTVAIDFDGVIHPYPRYQDQIEDLSPVPGTKEAIDDLRRDHRVVVYSSRLSHDDFHLSFRKQMQGYLEKYGILVDGLVGNKPIAVVYIDDRAILFKGTWEGIPGSVRNFKPWNRR